MATRKKEPSVGKTLQKSAKKAVRKMHPATKIIAVLALLLGIGAGVLAAFSVSKNDRFLLKGESAHSIEVGESYTYREEGVEAFSFGRDVSGKVKVETSLEKNEQGDYIIPTDKEGVYTIVYTVDCFKFGGKTHKEPIRRIRTFTVNSNEEDGRNGEE